MDPDNIRLWLQAINMLGTFGLGVWLYLEKRSDKTNERVSELGAKVEQLDKDVSALSATAGGAPNHSDLASVYESINGLSRTVHQLVGENRGQSDTLRLILNHITQKGLS